MATGLSAILLANRAALLRFLRARGAGTDGEDLLQDMWMKLQEKDIGPVADPLPYLYRMANNLMLDRYRSGARRARPGSPPLRRDVVRQPRLLGSRGSRRHPQPAAAFQRGACHVAPRGRDAASA